MPRNPVPYSPGRENRLAITPSSRAISWVAAERLADAGSVAISTGQLNVVCNPVGQHFDALYTAYRPLLGRMAIRKFGIPPADVDDLVHDVFATYLANPANVRGSLHRYLIGAICNASRQYRRRDNASPLCDASGECGATTDEELIEGVIRNLVIGATLRRLGDSCRDTLERFYLNGETAVAIAESRDTSPGYICRLLNYCRNRARSIYQEMSTGS